MLTTFSISRIVLRTSVLASVRIDQKRFLPAPRKRFYKNVSITSSDGKYEINLDQRKLKTPLGKVFQVPTEPLAIAVATEWDSQQKEIKTHTMHITGLCNTSIDNPMKKTKETTANELLEFLETDTLCCRVDEPEELVLLQQQKWDPVLLWLQERFQITVNISSDISCGVSVSAKDKDIMKRHLLSYNDWALNGIQYAAENLKSLSLAMACVNRQLDVETAVSLSRLELEFQIAKWGNVEWAHDVDLMQLRSRVAAAVLFALLNTESESLTKKAARLSLEN